MRLSWAFRPFGIKPLCSKPTPLLVIGIDERITSESIKNRAQRCSIRLAG
jgi:hypothetical protein